MWHGFFNFDIFTTDSTKLNRRLSQDDYIEKAYEEGETRFGCEIIKDKK